MGFVRLVSHHLHTYKHCVHDTGRTFSNSGAHCSGSRKQSRNAKAALKRPSSALTSEY